LLAVGFLAAFVAWLALSPDHLSTLIGSAASSGWPA
jgi:hypothetical protein